MLRKRLFYGLSPPKLSFQKVEENSYGETRELFVKNWLNKTIELDVSYFNITIPITTGIGTFNRFIAASRIEPIRNEFLSKVKVVNEPEMVMSYIYEPRSGILFKQLTENYLDDILTQKMGIILTWENLFCHRPMSQLIKAADSTSLLSYPT